MIFEVGEVLSNAFVGYAPPLKEINRKTGTNLLTAKDAISKRNQPISFRSPSAAMLLALAPLFDALAILGHDNWR